MGKILISCFILLLIISCTPKSGEQTDIMQKECCTIIIDCPAEIEIGNTVIIKAVLYDTDNTRIENTRNIRPNWMIDNNNVVLIKEVNGDECRVKAIKSGVCEIRVMQDKAVATISVTVK